MCSFCRKFANLKGSMYLVNSCQKSVKYTSELTIAALNYTMTGVCNKATGRVFSLAYRPYAVDIYLEMCPVDNHVILSKGAGLCYNR
jgi:hypothetical protein